MDIQEAEHSKPVMIIGGIIVVGVIYMALKSNSGNAVTTTGGGVIPTGSGGTTGAPNPNDPSSAESVREQGATFDTGNLFQQLKNALAINEEQSTFNLGQTKDLANFNFDLLGKTNQLALASQRSADQESVLFKTASDQEAINAAAAAGNEQLDQMKKQYDWLYGIKDDTTSGNSTTIAPVDGTGSWGNTRTAANGPTGVAPIRYDPTAPKGPRNGGGGTTPGSTIGSSGGDNPANPVGRGENPSFPVTNPRQPENPNTPVLPGRTVQTDNNIWDIFRRTAPTRRSF